MNPPGTRATAWAAASAACTAAVLSVRPVGSPPYATGSKVVLYWPVAPPGVAAGRLRRTRRQTARGAGPRRRHPGPEIPGRGNGHGNHQRGEEHGVAGRCVRKRVGVDGVCAGASRRRVVARCVKSYSQRSTLHWQLVAWRKRRTSSEYKDVNVLESMLQLLFDDGKGEQLSSLCCAVCGLGLCVWVLCVHGLKRRLMRRLMRRVCVATVWGQAVRVERKNKQIPACNRPVCSTLKRGMFRGDSAWEVLRKLPHSVIVAMGRSQNPPNRKYYGVHFFYNRIYHTKVH